MELATVKKINKMNIPTEIKELLYEKHGLNIHYYSNNIIDYIKDYFEILEEEYDNIIELSSCLQPRLEYEINKYLKKKKELENQYKQIKITKDYNVNTVITDIKNLNTYNEYNKYKSGYEYGKYIFHLWFIRILKDIERTFKNEKRIIK